MRGVKIAMDVFSGNRRGHGPVDMEGRETRAAIAALNGTQYKGKTLKVVEEPPLKFGVHH